MRPLQVGAEFRVGPRETKNPGREAGVSVWDGSARYCGAPGVPGGTGFLCCAFGAGRCCGGC